MDFYNFKRVVLVSSDGSRSRACLPTIILPPVVHQSKSLSDKRSTPAGGQDLSSPLRGRTLWVYTRLYERMIDALRHGTKINTKPRFYVSGKVW